MIGEVFMLGETHFLLGMASALIITHPPTIPGIIATMTGGAIGGWIVDIDIKNREKNDDEKPVNVYDIVRTIARILALITIDFFVGEGMCHYIISNWNVRVWGAFLGFLVLLLIGFNTKHRTFTHSFLALILYSGLAYLFCRPAAVPFLIGYASHIVSDLFNKKGVQILFPLKWKPRFNLLKSADPKVNRIVSWISLVIEVILIGFLLSKGIMAIDHKISFIQLLTKRKLFGLNFFQIYLIFVNVFTFLGFQRSYKE